MHFCFIYGSLEMGGMQTLMYRMATWLAKAGHRVTILSPVGGSMIDRLSECAHVVISEEWWSSIRRNGCPAAESVFRDAFPDAPVDVFYALSGEALWLAVFLRNAQRRPARLLAGVYGPWEFQGSRALSHVPALFRIFCPEINLFLRSIQPCCRVFMNEATRRHMEIQCGTSIPGVIWPLPVDRSRFTPLTREPEHGLIVSVGRLAPMKEYNLWMIDVVNELMRRGTDVRWEVYGDGPYRQEMEHRIRTLGLSDRITLMGELPYEDLQDAFRRAFLFVGMGTALVEAACAGIPAISATTYDTTGMSAGFIHELPEYCTGEVIDAPRKSVQDMVHNSLLLTTQQYDLLTTKTREHAARFDCDILMKQFVHLVESAPCVEQIDCNPIFSITSDVFRLSRNWLRRQSTSLRPARLADS